MFTVKEKMHSEFSLPILVFLALYCCIAFSGAANGQTTAKLQEAAKKPAAGTTPSAAPRQLKSIYQKVELGADADAVRKLLGKAEVDDKDGFFYEKDSEIIQIRLDGEKKVRLIAVTYSSDSTATPSFADIFGVEPTEARPDGSIYKLVRYPEAGYWIAYSRTAGEKPSVTVTMQKL